MSFLLKKRIITYTPPVISHNEDDYIKFLHKEIKGVKIVKCYTKEKYYSDGEFDVTIPQDKKKYYYTDMKIIVPNGSTVITDAYNTSDKRTDTIMTRFINKINSKDVCFNENYKNSESSAIDTQYEENTKYDAILDTDPFDTKASGIHFYSDKRIIRKTPSDYFQE